MVRDPVDAHDRGRARQLLRERRNGLDALERASAGEAILARLDELLRRRAPRVLAVYLAIRGEPDLGPAFDRWRDRGLVLALPRVVARDAPLQFGRWAAGGRLGEGPFGTRHPEPHEPVVPDVVVLPCLGFDERGHRLGYGGGYYDRTLAGLHDALTVGVAFEACAMRGFEEQPHDRPLDWVITERRALRRTGASG